MRKRFFIYSWSLFAVFNPTLVQASIDEEAGLGYDEILEELSDNRTRASAPKSADPFADLLIHAGVSVVTSYLTVRNGAGQSDAGFLRGIEARVGIDLFSRYWQAEGSVRSFAESDFERVQASLKEFDLKVVHRPTLARGVNLRLGAGISARYLSVVDTPSGRGPETEYSTPSSVFLLGFQARVHKNLSVGLDASYRSALIDETVDRAAVDLGLGIHALF